jgi:predicted RND superfamily exporter protein
MIGRLAAWLVDHPTTVVAAFLLATVGLGTGLSAVSTDAGTESFAEDIPSQNALDAVDRTFGPRFGPDTGGTTLIQRGGVLSKPAMLRMLRAQRALQERPGLRVSTVGGVAYRIGGELDPEARDLDGRIDAVEAASPAEIDGAVRTLAVDPSFRRQLSTDFNPETATASATIAPVSHDLSTDLSSQAGGGSSSPLTPIQLRAQRTVDATGAGDVQVFGAGILSDEFSTVISDSLLLVVPAAALLITLFLVVAYRDPLDLLIGIVALLMAIVWTFGFMGLARIPFSQLLITVPPLMLAVGVDFGIHAVNRYREERAADRPPRDAMERAVGQLLVAFGLVTGTTVIGFLANLTSALPPIKSFGLVASIGILFTLLVFGLFVPAAVLLAERVRRRWAIPGSRAPIGRPGSGLGRLLGIGAVIGRRAPVLVVVVGLVLAGGAAVQATELDTGFSNEDFLPPEETNELLLSLPEPFAPNEYTVTGTTNFLEERFATGQNTVTIYVEAPMEQGTALERTHRLSRDPPDSFETGGRSGRFAAALGSDTDGPRRAAVTDLATVIDSRAARDPAFARLVARTDRDGDGVPDRNLGRVYDALGDGGGADRYLADDRRSTRLVFEVESDAPDGVITADARAVADRYPGEATATGQIVVFQAIADRILASAVRSLAIALLATAIFLVVAYRVLVGHATLGLVNLLPIAVTVALVGGTMRALGLGFNAFTGTILAITIGLGVDYSVHVTHRFVDEFETASLSDALDDAVRGTGGALAGSVVTTASGIGVLTLAVFPAIGQFGILTAISVIYAFLTSVLLLPAGLVLWARYVADDSPATDAESPRTRALEAGVG